MDITLERIISLLKQQKKKQKDLTDFLGVNHNTFGNWKSGLNTSYKKYIHGIAEFLGVSVEYLRGETDIKEISTSSNDNVLTDSQREILSLFDSAAPEIKTAVLAVLKSADKD